MALQPQIALFPMGRGFSSSGTGHDIRPREQTIAFLSQLRLLEHNAADRSRMPYYFAIPIAGGINIVVPTGYIGTASGIVGWMFLGKWNGQGFIPTLWVHLDKENRSEFVTQKVPTGTSVSGMVFTVGKQYSPKGQGRDLVDQKQTLQKLATLGFQIYQGPEIALPQSDLQQIWVHQSPGIIFAHSASPNWDIVCRWSQSNRCYLPIVSVYHPDISHQFFTMGIPSGAGIIP